MKKTKKQHYVPRFYLKNFQIPNSHQVYVYDKVKNKIRINNIKDIASENYFYDIKFSEMLPKYVVDDLLKKGVSIASLDNEQYVENYLATTIETECSKLLGDLINEIKSITPWTLENCFFVSKSKKMDLSTCLAIQYIRTKSVRNSIHESMDCLMQALDDMNATQKLKSSMQLSKEDLKFVHSKMLLDKKQLIETASLFNQLTWVLGINKTSMSFWTSDTPIATRAHLSHPIISMAGLDSKGVEAFFPVSPEAVLVMVDCDYHKSFEFSDRRYYMITDVENIEYYNSLSAMKCDRCIYSRDRNFSLVNRMIKDNPKIFDSPKLEMSWSGRTYYPKKK